MIILCIIAYLIHDFEFILHYFIFNSCVVLVLYYFVSTITRGKNLLCSNYALDKQLTKYWNENLSLRTYINMRGQYNT